MATPQLPTSLPPGWDSDYDGTSERWFFVYRPTGFSQFFFPKAGDELTRVAELAQPQPTDGSLTVKMEAMTISQNTNSMAPNQTVVTTQQPQQNTRSAQTQPASTPHTTPSPQLQQSPQGSPIARTISQTVQRKAIPRRDSVQSHVSTQSVQSAPAAPQPAQQYQHVFNSQGTTQIVQNVQHTQQGSPQRKPFFRKILLADCNLTSSTTIPATQPESTKRTETARWTSTPPTGSTIHPKSTTSPDSTAPAISAICSKWPGPTTTKDCAISACPAVSDNRATWSKSCASNPSSVSTGIHHLEPATPTRWTISATQAITAKPENPANPIPECATPASVHSHITPSAYRSTKCSQQPTPVLYNTGPSSTE